MIKLVVTDLDGTFLNNRGLFDTKLFTDVHEQMQKKGIIFAACTGKQCERVEKLFGEHGKGIWILGDSAARIKKDGKVVKEFSIERDIALSAIEEIQRFADNMTIIVCASNAAYVHSSIPEDMYNVIKGSYEHVIKIGSFSEIDSPLIKITVYDPEERSSALRKHVELTLDGQIYIVDSEARWLDITELHTHKGETVKKLQEMLGVTAEETMSFGDGENDVELMAIAKYSFAVSNACENTKKAASFITKSNQENGVLITIQKMMDLF
ncbi:HAD-IIB family hydrolase [Paenibacillus sp. UMB7766-LJ446]|uniref:HAD-IIB family hydrolase n=1 Tax=Paenibacillus sp. UMB7766-LJ446 TaxID=3046313 RepID=UPI00255160AC|nr:HAD-IIB family hydrolase [Paenibacillus sp. UMB7766-LJ446]MDK8194080.1 HAD-IIB family hydrolase [Paenibacillus sp. UMB7766-LJ446]